MKIAVILIATGKYNALLTDPRFDIINSINKYFLPDEDTKIYLFTDGPSPGITNTIYQDQQPWPIPALFKFHSIYKLNNINADYVFYIDVDSRVVADIGDEILSDLTVVKHWSHDKYIRQRSIPFERDKRSTAAINDPAYVSYYSAAFFGGKKENVMHMAKTISDKINKDLRNFTIAKWHDESHFNRYLYDNKPTVILDRRYQARVNKEYQLDEPNYMKERDYKLIAVNIIDKHKDYRV